MTTTARVIGFMLATLTTFAVSAGAAWADEPVGPAWPDGEGRSTLDTLLLFVGGTVGLFVVVALFGLLTARNNYVPPEPSTDLEKAGDHSPAPHH